MDLFRIKICGVTRPDDAEAAATLGADAIGLNFYQGSTRFLHDDQATAICQVLPSHVAKVGVFVNSSPSEIRAKVKRFNLDWVQLHGDEPPGITSELSGIRVIRAIRVGDSARKYLAALAPSSDRAVKLPAALLVDAFSPDTYGGTGQTIDWSSFSSLREQAQGLPIILAGGLTGENVAEAIRIARPDAVDTASGVESQPGMKDYGRMKDFICAGQTAFAANRATI